MPSKNVANGLVRMVVSDMNQRTRDPIITPITMSASVAGSTRGRPGYDRLFEPSNFAATSRRYQPRIVSGLAIQVTLARAFRPNLRPISASVARSGSDKRSRDGNCVRKILFSAAKYSFAATVPD